MTEHVTATSHPIAETRILSAALQGAPIASIDLDAPDFVSPERQAIWGAVLALHYDGEPVDLVALSDRLVSDAAAKAALLAIPKIVVTPEKLATSIVHVRERANRRRIQESASTAHKRVDAGHHSGDVAAQVVADMRLLPGSAKGVSSAEAGAEIIAAAERACKGEDVGLPLPAGLSEYVKGGLRPGRVYVLGGGTGDGKTALALQIGREVAAVGKPVAYWSMEMQAVELHDRYVSNETGGAHTTNPVRAAEVVASIERFARHVTYYDQQAFGRITPAAIARETMARKPALVVVDYLQLVQGPRAQNRELEVAAVSRALKHLALSVPVAVLALSQYNREAGKRGEPKLSDLRESGAIEQDADVVLLMSSDGVATMDGTYPVKIKIAKNRQGKRGDDLVLKFKPAYFTFTRGDTL